MGERSSVSQQLSAFTRLTLDLHAQKHAQRLTQRHKDTQKEEEQREVTSCVQEETMSLQQVGTDRGPRKEAGEELLKFIVHQKGTTTSQQSTSLTVHVTESVTTTCSSDGESTKLLLPLFLLVIIMIIIIIMIICYLHCVSYYTGVL